MPLYGRSDHTGALIKKQYYLWYISICKKKIRIFLLKNKKKI